jgi:predicted rRNA methylase YqxC with S4 and FtsJ domains
VGKGGVIRSSEVRQAVLDELWADLQAQGWQRRGLVDSPVRGSAGNLEQLWWLSPQP